MSAKEADRFVGAIGDERMVHVKHSGKLYLTRKREITNDEPTRRQMRALGKQLNTTSSCFYCASFTGLEVKRRGAKHLMLLTFEQATTDVRLDKFLSMPLRFGRGYFEFPTNTLPYLPLRVLRSFMFQLCKGLAIMHESKINHRCLCPERIMLDEERGVLKIGGWDCKTCINQTPSTYLTEEITYRAPEGLIDYTRVEFPNALDIWSAGCIFCEMSTGVPPFIRQGWQLRIGPVGLDPCGQDLMEKMLHENPESRISANVALNHAFFDEIDVSQY